MFRPFRRAPAPTLALGARPYANRRSHCHGVVFPSDDVRRTLPPLDHRAASCTYFLQSVGNFRCCRRATGQMGGTAWSALAAQQRFAHTGNTPTPPSEAQRNGGASQSSAVEDYLVNTARLQRAMQPSVPLPKLATVDTLDLRKVARKVTETAKSSVLKRAVQQSAVREAALKLADGAAVEGQSASLRVKVATAPHIIAVLTKQPAKKALDLQQELEDTLALRGVGPSVRVVVLDRNHSRLAKRIIPRPAATLPESPAATVSPSSPESNPAASTNAAAATAAEVITPALVKSNPTSVPAASNKPLENSPEGDDAEEEYEEVVEEVEVDEEGEEEASSPGETVAPAASFLNSAHGASASPLKSSASPAAPAASPASAQPPSASNAFADIDNDLDEMDALMSEAIQQSHRLQERAKQQETPSPVPPSVTLTASEEETLREPPAAAASSSTEAGKPIETPARQETPPVPPSPPPPAPAEQQAPPDPVLEVPATLEASATYYVGAPTVYLSDRALLDLPAIANVLVLDATSAFDDDHVEDVLKGIKDPTTPFGYLLTSPNTFAPAADRTVTMDSNKLKVGMLAKIFVFRTNFTPATARRVRSAMAQALNGVSGQERNRVCVLDAKNSEDANPLEGPSYLSAAKPADATTPVSSQGSDSNRSKTDAATTSDNNAAPTGTTGNTDASAPEGGPAAELFEPADDTPPEEEQAVEEAAAQTSPFHVFTMFGAELDEPIDLRPADGEIRRESKEWAETVDIVDTVDPDDGPTVAGAVGGASKIDMMDDILEDTQHREATATSEPHRPSSVAKNHDEPSSSAPPSFLSLSPAMAMSSAVQETPSRQIEFPSHPNVGKTRRAEGAAYAWYRRAREARARGDAPPPMPQAAPIPTVPKRQRLTPPPRVRRVSRLAAREARVAQQRREKLERLLRHLAKANEKAAAKGRTGGGKASAGARTSQRSSTATRIKTPAALRRNASSRKASTSASPSSSRVRRRKRSGAVRKPARRLVKEAAAKTAPSTKSAGKAIKATAAAATAVPKKPTSKTFAIRPKKKRSVASLPSEVTVSVLEMKDDVAVLTGPLNEHQRLAALRRKREQWRRHKPAASATGVTATAISAPPTVTRSERLYYKAPTPIRDAIARVHLSAKSPPPPPAPTATGPTGALAGNAVEASTIRGAKGRKKKEKPAKKVRRSHKVRHATRVDDFLLDRMDVLNKLCEGTTVYPRAYTERSLQPYFPAYAGRYAEIRFLAPISTIVCVSEQVQGGASARNPVKVALSDWSVDVTVASIMAALTSAEYDNGDMREVLKRNRTLSPNNRRYIPVVVLIIRNGTFTTEECREQQRVIEEALKRQWHQAHARVFVVPRL